MWAWQSGKCARYLRGAHTPGACTHLHTLDAACNVAASTHAGWLRNTDDGWRCDLHSPTPRLIGQE